MDYLLALPKSIFQGIRLANVVVYPLNWRISFLTFLHALNGAYIYRRNLMNQNARIPFIQGLGKLKRIHINKYKKNIFFFFIIIIYNFYYNSN